MEIPRCCAPCTTFGRDLGYIAAQIRQRGGFILARKRDLGVSAGPAAARKASAAAPSRFVVGRRRWAFRSVVGQNASGATSDPGPECAPRADLRRTLNLQLTA